MKIKKRFFILIFLFNLSFFYGSVYISGLKLSQINEKILIEWFANTNSFDFLIFKNYSNAIKNKSEIKTSILIASNKFIGEKVDNFYRYSFIDTENEYSKNLFYIILPDRELKEGDFAPNINFNLKPFVLKEIKKIEIEKIKNLFGKRFFESIILIWDVEGVLPEEELIFDIYRDVFPITNVDNLKPYITNIKDFYFEDFNIDYDKSYYYFISLNNNKDVDEKSTIEVSSIMNLSSTNIKIEKEILERRKIKAKDFLEKFKKGK
ncbi:MAG: hypothetical protein ACP5QT_06265 [Brevinematia bacterium]